jgi:hypothetical protein
MKGKSLAVFLDTYQEIQMPQGQQQFGRQPMYRPINTGIDKILDHYGVAVEKAYVMDMNCYEQRVQQIFGGGKRALYFAPLIKNENINNDLPFMKNIKGLIMLMSAPVRLDQSALDENGLLANTLLSSSEQSWLMKGRINLMAMQPPANDAEMQSQPLAALIEGEFPSYFAGKGIPEKPEEPEEGEPAGEEGGENASGAAEPGAPGIAAAGSGEEEGEPLKDFTPVGAVIDRGGQGKIFITGTAEILRDNVVDENGTTPNATWVLNVLDNLNSRDEYAEMRSKTQRFNPLKDTGAGVKAFVKMLNIAGLPLLVVLYGILVWVRRTARKRTIQAMFSR